MKDYDTKKIFLINYKAVYGETWDNYGTKEIGIYECKSNTIAYKISDDKYIDLIKGYSVPKSMITSIKPANIQTDKIKLEDAITFYKDYVNNNDIQNSEILLGKEYKPNCPLPKFFGYSPFEDRKNVLNKIIYRRQQKLKREYEKEGFIFCGVNSFVDKLTRTLSK